MYNKIVLTKTHHSLSEFRLLASIACVSMYKDLLFQVVDPEQEFDKNYCGIDYYD